MKVGKPDAETRAPREASLVERLAARLRDGGDASGTGLAARRLAMLVAALIVAGPVLTLGGAKLLIARERAASAALQADLAPRIAAARSAEAARRELAQVLRQRSLGQVLEVLGRVLPPGSTLVRLERTGQGALEFDVATPDPDRLRMALRRAPEFAQIRNVGQRQADGGLIVSFLGGAE